MHRIGDSSMLYRNMKDVETNLTNNTLQFIWYYVLMTP